MHIDPNGQIQYNRSAGGLGPDEKERAHLSAETGVTAKQVATWFDHLESKTLMANGMMMLEPSGQLLCSAEDEAQIHSELSIAELQPPHHSLADRPESCCTEGELLQGGLNCNGRVSAMVHAAHIKQREAVQTFQKLSHEMVQYENMLWHTLRGSELHRTSVAYIGSPEQLFQNGYTPSLLLDESGHRIRHNTLHRYVEADMDLNSPQNLGQSVYQVWLQTILTFGADVLVARQGSQHIDPVHGFPYRPVEELGETLIRLADEYDVIVSMIIDHFPATKRPSGQLRLVYTIEGEYWPLLV